MLAFAAGGCGGGDNPAKRVGCLTSVEGKAATVLIARLYAEGKLGTPAEFKKRYFRDVPRSAYLDGSGHLKTWSSITGQAGFDLGRLIFDLQVSRRYGRQIQAAFTRARLRSRC